MKKFFVAVLAAVSIVTANAQQPVGTFSIQPKVGLNIASLTDTDDDDGARTGFVIGVEGMHQASDNVGLSLGVLYSQQGATGEDRDYDTTVKLDYINVPIMANVYVVKGLALKLGLQLGFLVNDKCEVKNSSFSAEVDLEDAFKKLNIPISVKSVDFSIPVGLSYEYSNVVLDARYNWGLTEVINGMDLSMKNSVFQFTLGYKF